MSKFLSNKIANIGFVCACFVVLMHVPPVVSGGVMRMFFMKYVRWGIADSIAVPVFFIISGFLLRRHIFEDGWYLLVIRKRVRTLVVPFFLLNAAWFPIKMGIHYIAVLKFGADNTYPSMNFDIVNVITQIGLLPWGNAINGFWFIRTLFYMFVISPFLVWFIKKGRLATVALLSFLLVGWCFQSSTMWHGVVFGRSVSSLMHYEFCLKCPLYFAIGLALPLAVVGKLCLMQAVRSKRAYIFGGAILVMSITLFVKFKLTQLESVCMTTAIGFVMTILLAISVWTLMPTRSWPYFFSGNAFPIYAFHGALIYLLPIPLKALGKWNGSYDIIGPIAFTCVVIILSCGFGMVIRKKFPKVAKIIFGGR